MSFRTALVVLTRGATPARQGARASLYAAVTYTVAAAGVLGMGWVANIVGPTLALFCSLGAIGLVALTALAGHCACATRTPVCSQALASYLPALERVGSTTCTSP